MGSQLAKKLFTETVTVNPEMPWLDCHGRTLSDPVLKFETKNWNEKTWEAYLKSIETPIRETLISESVFNCLVDKQTGSIFLNSQEACSEALREKIERSVLQLSKRQQQIVHMIFWKNLSEREIARILGITRPTVQVTKKRALQRLQHFITLESRPTKILEPLADVLFRNLKGA